MTDYHSATRPLRLDQWVVELPRYSYGSIRPFKKWTATRPPAWWNAYNQVKHNRAGCFEQARFENLLGSMAGLYILLAAQYGLGIGVGRVRGPMEEERVFTLTELPAWDLEHHYTLNYNGQFTEIKYKPALDQAISSNMVDP